MTIKELNTIFGQNIKKFRKNNGWSQADLADKMDLSVNTISEIETGKKFVHAETLLTFATILETEVYELLKPETVLPDNTKGVLVKYGSDIKKSIDELMEDYLQKIK
jgi:transcriptional regulator with XRE-family HTH domain